MKKVAFIVLAAMLGALVGFIAWGPLDKRGWIPHHQVTSVWSPVERPWQIGEYLDCAASPRGGTLTKPGYGSTGVASLGCARDWEYRGTEKGTLTGRAEAFHLTPQDVQVTYWGRIRIPYPESAQLYRQMLMTQDFSAFDKLPFRWRCRRNQSSVTCWAVN